MPVTVNISILRPLLQATDTVTAAVYNAHGVAGMTGAITGAVATDGSTPITGDLTVSGALTVGGTLTVPSFSPAGLFSAGSLRVGADGSTLTRVRSGTVSATLTAGAAGTTATVTVTAPGATAAGIRAYFLNDQSQGDFAIRSWTVAAGDAVTLTYARVTGSGYTGARNIAYLHLN